MLDNLDLVGLVLRTRYAPADFKGTEFDWDLDDELRKARRVVLKSLSLSCMEYQELVRRIFESARDYHAAAVFDYLESKTLPFFVHGGRDPSDESRMRYFVVYVAEDWKDRIPLGAELTRFGEDPTAVAVEKLMKEIRRSNVPSDRTLATTLLTARSAEAGHPIPAGPDIEIELDSRSRLVVPWSHEREDVPCDIQLRRFAATGNAMTTFTLAAATASATSTATAGAIASTVMNPTSVSNTSAPSANLVTFGSRAVVGRMLVLPLYRSLQKLDIYEKNPHGLGRKQSFFPPLGEPVWSADPATPYYAYIYELGERTVGFIRIADYLHEAGKGDAERDAFADLVRKMEVDTDALVIDQFNNQGGSLFHLYALVSMLSAKPLEVPWHQVTLDRREVLDFAKLRKEMQAITTPDEATSYRKAHADEFGGYPFTLKEVGEFRRFAEFVVEEFATQGAGSVKVLTPRAALMGVDSLSPSTSAVYTKPILLLINELDFSGGDFLPAILKDAKRATLMGVGTAGAGGYIMEMSYFNPFGIGGFYVTASHAIRRDGTPIENRGVTPDVEYELSADDLKDRSYKELIESVNRQVATLS